MRKLRPRTANDTTSLLMYRHGKTIRWPTRGSCADLMMAYIVELCTVHGAWRRRVEGPRNLSLFVHPQYYGLTREVLGLCQEFGGWGPVPMVIDNLDLSKKISYHTVEKSTTQI